MSSLLALRLNLLVRCTMAIGVLASPIYAAQAQQPVAAQTTGNRRLSVAQLRKLYGDARSRYMTIRGVEVHYKDEGRGPVLFMVHGSVSTLRTWDRISQLLKNRYRIIRYDIPGYGLSGRISDQAAIEVQPVDIAAELLDRLGVKKATVVGVSSGGTMSMYLAAKRPEMVERLILSNTPSDPVTTSHLVEPASFVAAQKKAKETGFMDQAYWNEWLTYWAGAPARISARTRKEYYDFNRREPEKHPIALVAKIGDGREANIEMAKVRAPTFLIWGGADRLLPEPASVTIAKHLSSAQVSRAIMPDVGHYPPLESPDRFAQLMIAFIEAATPNVGSLPTEKP